MTRPDFPLTLSDFIRRFRSEEACWRYLVDSRWPDGWQCPVCGEKKAYLVAGRKVFECAKGHQSTAIAGTVLQATHLPLSTWFQAAFLLTTHTPGISALQLARQLGLRYETAYMMLQKLRAGLVKPDRGQIGGEWPVQMDETYWGAKVKGGKRGRGAPGKTIIIGAVEVRHGGAGRLRLLQIPDVGTASISGFVRQYILPGTRIITDDLTTYRILPRLGFEHEVVVGETLESVAEEIALIHRIFSNLKAWLLGTHHGRISPKHMQAYLNEFVFRFNRRGTPMAAFQTSLGIGSHIQAPTYRGIYEGSWHHPNSKGSPVATG